MGSQAQPLLPKGFNPFDRLARNPKVAKYIQSVSDVGENPKLQETLESLKPCVLATLSGLRYVVQLYFSLYSAAYAFVEKLPQDELKFVIGFILCFFGGVFVALIAAVEAFRTMGGQSLYDDMAYVQLELDNVLKAHDADEQVDANRDGIRDVEAMGSQELVQHKTILVMQSIADPKRLQGAVGNLWSAYLAVIATLSLKFAQTTAYALAISEMVKFPVTRVVAPPLAYALGSNLVNWVDVIIDSTLKAIVILLVWFFARIRAAFYSGLRGGQMLGAATVRICQKHGWTDSLPWVKKPFNPDESYLDEVIGYPLALVGFYFQMTHYFGVLPFPLDWLLWPLSFVEGLLEIQISW
ncbi:unnamed protein product [Durusdinium trenchii]|uniref:Uncharacterized protein n=2 Tax=Durusdinium trenchii TaxID=1381693 RepID=A0ABP0L7Q5_9DINO